MSHSFSQHHGAVLGAGDKVEKRDTALTTRRADSGWRLNEITGHKAKHCGPLPQVPVKFLGFRGFSAFISESWVLSTEPDTLKVLQQVFVELNIFSPYPKAKENFRHQREEWRLPGEKAEHFRRRWWPAWNLAWDQVLGPKKGEIFSVEPRIILFYF